MSTSGFAETRRTSFSNGKLITTIFSLLDAEYLTRPMVESNSCRVVTLRISSMYSFRLSASSSSGVRPFFIPPATKWPIESIKPANLISGSCNSISHFCWCNKYSCFFCVWDKEWLYYELHIKMMARKSPNYFLFSNLHLIRTVNHNFFRKITVKVMIKFN